MKNVIRKNGLIVSTRLTLYQKQAMKTLLKEGRCITVWESFAKTFQIIKNKGIPLSITRIPKSELTVPKSFSDGWYRVELDPNYKVPIVYLPKY